jgi:hypothetical protein
MGCIIAVVNISTDLPLHHCMQTTPGAQPASYPIDMKFYFPEIKWALSETKLSTSN